MSEVVIEKRTTIHKVGGSMMITLPKVVAEALMGMGDAMIKDQGKKFHATIRLNNDSSITVLDIRERETVVRKRKSGK
jgi:antitoxin component of MazEF toxin-antitoxin module